MWDSRRDITLMLGKTTAGWDPTVGDGVIVDVDSDIVCYDFGSLGVEIIDSENDDTSSVY